MTNENLEPFRNPTRDNKTIKSGYKSYEDKEDKKNADSERSPSRNPKANSGKFFQQENDFDRSGVGGSESGGSDRSEKKQKSTITNDKKNSYSNLSGHQEDARKQ